MNERTTSPQDRALNQALREWKISSELPPRFQESVWRRIENTESDAPGWASLFQRFAAAITRPSLATSYLASLLLVGLLAGYWQARAVQAKTEQDLRARYVQLVDPYQNAHSLK